jgi:mannose/cellobiose epimerase-like protein (N-acyl-D-glucosamine 2-epimerase family)
MAMSRSQMEQQVSKSPSKEPRGLTYYKRGGRASPKSKGSKICPAGKAWAKRTFDTYPSAYANMAASKYCKDPNYAKGAKGKKKKKA